MATRSRLLSPFDPAAVTDSRVLELYPEGEDMHYLAEGLDPIPGEVEEANAVLAEVRAGRKPVYFTPLDCLETAGLQTVTYYHDLAALRRMQQLSRIGYGIIPINWRIISRLDRTLADFLDARELAVFIRSVDPDAPLAILGELMPLTPARAVYHALRRLKTPPYASEHQFFKNLLMGKLYGYPDCCVRYFSLQVAGRIQKHPLHEYSFDLIRMPPTVCHLRCFDCTREYLDKILANDATQAIGDDHFLLHTGMIQ